MKGLITLLFWITLGVSAFLIASTLTALYQEVSRLGADLNPDQNGEEEDKSPIFSLFKSKRAKNVPILTYHYIRDYHNQNDPVGIGLSVSPETFESQMQYLSENSYQTISLQDLVKGNIPDKPVILTFDDGYEDAYTQALPVLDRYGFKATFFIVVDFVGKSRYLNDDQVKALREAGMVIGSHSLSHSNLTSLDDKKLEAEIFESKERLDAGVFAYPGGQFNDEVVKIVKKAGYVAAVTTRSGFVTSSSNPLKLPRLKVGPSTSLATLLNPKPKPSPVISPKLIPEAR